MLSKSATAGVCSRCDVIVRQRWVLWGRAGDAADRFRWPWGQGNLTYFLFTEGWKEKHAWHRCLAGCSQSYSAQPFTAQWQLHVAPSGWTVKDCIIPTEWRSPYVSLLQLSTIISENSINRLVFVRETFLWGRKWLWKRYCVTKVAEQRRLS